MGLKRNRSMDFVFDREVNSAWESGFTYSCPKLRRGSNLINITYLNDLCVLNQNFKWLFNRLLSSRESYSYKYQYISLSVPIVLGWQKNHH